MMLQAVGVVEVIVLMTALLSRSDGVEYCHVKTPSSGKDAQVRLSLFSSLRKSENNHCGEILAESVQTYVTVAWVIDKLNKGDGFIPGIKFGFDLFDDCQNELYTARNVLSILHPTLSSAVTNCTGSDSAINLGIIGPSRSATAAEAARLLKSSRIPLISPSATVPDLSDKDKYPSFFRTALPDTVQVRPILEILKELDWTYVVVVHSDDIYGKTAAAMLKTEGRKIGVCFIKSIEVTTTSIRKDVFDDLRAVKEDTRGETLGVVYFGMWGIAESLMDYYSRNQEYGNMHWLMSDSVGTMDEVFPNSDNSLVGTITLSPSTSVIEDLRNFWYNKMLDNEVVSEYLSQSEHNRVVINASLSDYTSATIDATYAYAVALKDLHGRLCNGVSGLCDKLKNHLNEQGLLTDIKGVKVNYTALDEAHVPAEFVEEQRYFSFKDTGDINRGSDSILYHINSYQGGSGLNKFKVIGGYSVNGLTLNKTAIKTIPNSICEGYCKECVDFGKVPMVYLEGDVYIVGVFSLHEANEEKPFQCGDFRNVSSDTVALEAFIHAVIELRSLTSIRYGVVAFDDCYSPARLTSIVSEYFSSVGNPAVFKDVVPLHKVVAVIGTLSSGSTIPLARFFSNLNIPVISYASSSPDLDDRVNFPNFLRTVPSDVEQAKAMVDIIKDMGWEYVSLLFVDNNYGTKGMQQFQRLAMEAGICVSTAKNISEKEGPSGPSIPNVVNELIQEGAKVVVFFGIDTRFEDFVREVNKNNYGKFVIIASEDWGNKQGIIDAGKFATRGTITLKLEALTVSPFPHFKQKLLATTPLNNQINPWFSEFWQHQFRCNIPGGFNNIFDTECSNDDRLPEEQMRTHLENQRVSHVQYAVYGAGMGVDTVKKTLCRDFLNDFPCRFYYEPNYAHTVWETIRQVKRPLQQSFLFDDVGNGDIGFTVYNIQENPENNNKIEYVQVGIYGSRGLKLDKEKLRFYNHIGQQHQVQAKCETGSQCSMCELNKLPLVPAVTDTDSKTEPGLRVTEIIIIVIGLIVVIVIIVALVLGYKYLRNKYADLSKEIQKYGARDTEHIYQAVSDRMVYQNRQDSPERRPVPPQPQPIYFVNGSNASLDEDRGHVNHGFRAEDTTSQRNISGGTVTSTGVTNTSSNSTHSPGMPSDSSSQTPVRTCVSPTSSGHMVITDIPLSYSEAMSNGHVPNGVLTSPASTRPSTLHLHQNTRFVDPQQISAENLSPVSNRVFNRPDLQHMPETYVGSPGSSVSQFSDQRQHYTVSHLDHSTSPPHVLLNQHSPPLVVADPTILQTIVNQQAALDQQAAYTALELQRLQMLQQNALNQMPANPYIHLSSATSNPPPPPPQYPLNQQRSPGEAERPRLRTNPRMTRELVHGSVDSLRSSGRSQGQVLAASEEPAEHRQEDIPMHSLNHESRISRV